jgi:DMSO/TMAO reductase YedYZ molybdopterin-dependent catalytic subunit
MRHFSILTLFLFATLPIGLLSLWRAQSQIVRVGATQLPQMSLTIVGANSTQVVLNEADIAGLPSYRGYGGFKNQLGNVRGLGNYTGVSLSTLCGLVGGMTNASNVTVIASDVPPYSANFTFDMVMNGNFTTYTSNGQEVHHSQPLMPIVAYYFNDASISESNGGPLRLVIVGPEGLVTDSKYWVKWAVTVEVISQTVFEFPSPLVLSLLLFAISVIAFGFKASRRKGFERQRGFAD